MFRRAAPLLLRTLPLLLVAIAVSACSVRGGGSNGDDDDAGATCGDADTAMQACFQTAGLGEAFTSLYCPATNLEPGTAGYMGPGTDWECFVAAWDYECSEIGVGDLAAAECTVDPGNVGDDDDATSGDDDDATSGDDDDATSGDDDDSTMGDDDDSTMGDDDDSTMGDDDDSTMGDDDDSTSGSTGPNVLPCNVIAYDIYEVWGAGSGQNVEITIDTVSAATTFDPYLLFTTNASTDPAATTLATYDDDFVCAFPPPQWECPQGSETVPSGGTLYFAVGHASSNCAGTLANYSIVMTVNGSTSNDFSLATDDWQ